MAAAEPAAAILEAPLTAGLFDRLMAPLGPFEPRPALAVGVSGGADSLALSLLAADWVRARKGRLTALIVDHGLRAASRDEAAVTRARLAERGIAAVILPWRGQKPATGLQARARRARLGLLLDWCRGEGALHLLLAHHARDQRETVLMRLMRGSGLDGLAGMRPITETADVRILRPLLDVEPERLRALLIARRQEWIEDPSNTDPAFARARLRGARPLLAAAGVSDAALDHLCEQARTAADALDVAVTAVLAHGCRLDPAGHARLDRDALLAAPPEIAWRVLARVLACVGGRAWPPSRASVARLLARLPTAASGSLGCLARAEVIAADGSVLVCRERRGLPAPAAIAAGGEMAWDGRFVLALCAPPAPAAGELRIAPLAAGGWRQIAKLCRDTRRNLVPWRQRLGLPALFDGESVVSVPHLGYTRPDWYRNPLIVDLRPLRTLAGTGYFTGRCF